MASVTSQLIVRLIDQVSGPASAAGRALQRLVAQSNVTAGAGLASLSNQLSTIQTRAQLVARNATQAVATAAAPAAIGAVQALRTAVDFSRELNKASAIGELTEAQRRDVARTAREIGASTQFSAAQALAMQRTLIAAGRTVEQAQGMARPILNSALFGDVDPATAADGIIAITSAYRLQMRTIAEAEQQATRVGDILAKAANESRASFQDIMQGFKYAAPIANAAGWSMEQVAAAIAHMTNNGLRGDEAGVAIRSMLVRMVKPTQDARQAMAELGLSFDQFFGRMQQFNLSNFSSGMRQAGHALNDTQRRQIGAAVVRNNALPADQQRDLGQVLTEAMISALNIPQSRVQDRQKITRAVQRYASSLADSVDPDALFKALQEANVTPGQMARIFDARQGSRLMTLLGPEYQRILDKIRREAAGASERGAAQMERGLYGAMKRIQSAIEALVLSIAESGIADRIAEVFNSISNALRSISQTDPGALRAIGYAMLALAAAAPVGLTLIGLAAIFKTLAAAASVLTAVMAPVALPIIAVVAALAALGVWIANNTAQIKAFAQGFSNAFNSRFPGAAKVVGQVSDAVGWLVGKIGDLFGALGTSSTSLETWAGRGAIAATKIGDAIEAVSAIGTKIADGFRSAFTTIDEVGQRVDAAVALFVSQVKTKIDEIVAYLQALPGKMAAAVSTGATALYHSGAKLMQSLYDGIKTKFDEVLAYIQAIPGRIGSAIGSIRLPRLSFGGGTPAPANDAAGEGGPQAGSTPPSASPAPADRRSSAMPPVGLAQQAGEAFGNAAGLGVRSTTGQAQEAGTAIGRIIADAARTAAEARQATSVPVIVPDRSFSAAPEEGGDAGAAATRIGEQVGTAIKAAEGTARDAGQSLGAAVPPGIRAAEPGVREAGHRLGAAIPEGVRASEAQAREAGSAIGRAIAQGARLAAGAAAAAGAGGGGSGGATQGPARASGGRVNAGTVYGVGERGRELFVPDQNGTIFGNRGRAGGTEAGGSARLPAPNISFAINVTGGGSDGEKLARTIRSELDGYVESTLRSLMSDYGVSYST